MLDPPSNRLVIRSIRAWNIDPPADQEHIPEGIVSVGEPITIEPLSGIEVLLWTHVNSETRALVLWRHTLYLVKEDDLETRTMRVIRSADSSDPIKTFVDRREAAGISKSSLGGWV